MNLLSKLKTRVSKGMSKLAGAVVIIVIIIIIVLLAYYMGWIPGI